ncbi:MAG: HD domain-containing protein [Polyangiaceae bacterium]|nr:HD domain-containing protein [Polyangiaceae bacterium]
MYEDLAQLLHALDGVEQNPRWHPEGDALYHSLQAFDLARRESDDRQLWAAALLHDVGKGLRCADHDEVGADLLDGLVAPRVVWLVRHHLDLMRAPAATRRRVRDKARLSDLERLRRWDVRGRSPTAVVLSVSDALDTLLADGGETLVEGADAPSSSYEEAQH